MSTVECQLVPPMIPATFIELPPEYQFEPALVIEK
jgi:hypothetical protein